MVHPDRRTGRNPIVEQDAEAAAADIGRATNQRRSGRFGQHGDPHVLLDFDASFSPSFHSGLIGGAGDGVRVWGKGGWSSDFSPSPGDFAGAKRVPSRNAGTFSSWPLTWGMPTHAARCRFRKK